MSRKRKFIDNLCQCQCRSRVCFDFFMAIGREIPSGSRTCGHGFARKPGGNAAMRRRVGELESKLNSGQDEPVPSRRRFSYPRDFKRVPAGRLGTNGPALTSCVSLRMTRNVSTVQNESAAPACTECEGGCRSFHLPLRFRAEGPTQRSACLQRVRCTIEGTRKCVGVPGNARAGNRRAVPLPRA